ncbi:hypothetical protein NQZ68_012216 [Dissostichus eleginoides]|nr:hypothetical protein NQZ68_012216 [Dissostichus eleginoides]
MLQPGLDWLVLCCKRSSDGGKGEKEEESLSKEVSEERQKKVGLRETPGILQGLKQHEEPRTKAQQMEMK